MAETEVARDWPLKPSGLGPGDQFRLIFASSTTRNANPTAIANYNTFVQNRAAAGHSAIQSHSSGFRVVGCTEDVDARDNTSTTGTGVPIYWLSGNKVADDYADFYDGSWDDEANPKDESGNDRTLTGLANQPFTGCDHDGTEAPGNDNALGDTSVRLGTPNGSGAGHGPLSGNANIAPSNSRSFYGLSEVFRVMPPTAPGAPSNLTAVAGDTFVRLFWDEPSDNGGATITGYQYRHASAWTTTTDRQATVSGLTNGTEYTFEVRAVNSQGEGDAASINATPVDFVCTEPDLTGRTEVWTGTVTVGLFTYVPGFRGLFGYDTTQTPTVGALSETEFTIGSTDYTIDRLYEFNKEPGLSLDKDLTTTDQARLRLHLCNQTFEFSDANLRANSSYTWLYDRNTDWSAALNISAALSSGEPNTAATGMPEISGTPQVGQRLTANTGTIADDDGLPSIFRYQWVRVDGMNESNVGTNSQTYTVVAADLGKRLKVEMSFTDNGGNREGPLASALTDIVTEPGDLPAPSKPRVYPSPMMSGAVDELEVIWKHPGNPFDPPRVDHYDLRYRMAGRLAWSNGPQNVTIRKATITGLAEGTKYEVQVRATNSEGDGPWSPSGQAGTRTEGQPKRGDLRLVGDVDDEGRLEVFHNGKWGTVCSDRFQRTYAHNPPRNYAPAMACRQMGYAGGEYASGYGQPGVTDDPDDPDMRPFQPIWLDELHCGVGSTHWTGSPPTRLEHCTHAGWGLENCDHTEDAGVRCTGGKEPLNAEFSNMPSSHDGSTFSFYLEFTEEADTNAGDLRDHSFKVSGNADVTDVFGNAADPKLWLIWVTPSSGEDVVITLPSFRPCDGQGAICTETGKQLSTMLFARVPYIPGQSLQEVADPLIAEFQDVPTSHTGEPFTLRFALSEDIVNTVDDVADHAFNVIGATLTSVTRVDDRQDLWELTLEPEGTAGIAITLTEGECGEPGVLCTANRIGLAYSYGIAISGPSRVIPPDPSALTASFAEVPETHDGEKKFRVRLNLSAEIDNQGTPGRLRDAIQVTGATLDAVWRVNEGEPDRVVRIQPDGDVPITITLPATADCADPGALCTRDGARLEEGATATVKARIGISISPASVEEAPGAKLEFKVELSRAAASEVSVDFATEDTTGPGSAEGGSGKSDGKDYKHKSGTLRFPPGTTVKYVRVKVYDDAHDEGSETMKVKLSNPVGAYIAVGEAIGTIHNSDAMPKAWLARIGRTVAEQVVEAAESRLRAPPRVGAEVRLAGQIIGGPGAAPEGEAAADAEARSRLETLTRWLREETGEERVRGAQTRAVTERDLLTRSSFALAAGAESGGIAGVWGRGAVSRFSGRAGELSLDGEVTGAMLGADWTGPGSGAGSWAAGLMVAHARGEGSYRGADSGEVESDLTGVYPYGRYALSGRVTLWGVAGYGAGTLRLTPEGRKSIETDMDLTMASAGLRGVVVEAPADGGPELAITTDALAVRTTSAAVRGDGGNLASAEAGVTRLRLGLEGSYALRFGEDATLTPRLEVGVRQDGGDAETGYGLDVGGGVAWSDRASGVSAELSGRGLLTHEAGGFGDRGFAGSLSWDPRPDTERGFSLSLRQTVGTSATGGMDALLARDTLAGLAANDDGDELARRRLEVRLGYGFSAFGDRFTARPELGLGLSNGARDYRLGWRLVRRGVPGDTGALELAVEATRRESANDDTPPEHGVGLRLTARW